MFILSAIEEEVRVHPQDLHKSPVDAVTEVIERRYLDRVMPDLGLVVTLYDIQSIEGGFIYPNDGAAFFRTKFRLVVFRPFVGEVLVGRLKSCSKAGLTITLDFFDDVQVPEHSLPDPSFYNEATRLWVWKYKADEGDEGTDMPMDIGEPVIMRVRAVKFPSPPTPLQLQNAASEEERLIGTESHPFVPMEVVGEMNEDGLGMASWWAPADEEGGDDGAEAE